MTHHTVYFELRDALAEPGCALCRLALRSVTRYLDALTYESVNDPAIRDALRDAVGFCAVHGQQLRQAHAALGSAIIHRDVIMALADELASVTSAQPSVGERLRVALGGSDPPVSRRAILTPGQPCPACARRRVTEEHFADLLAHHLTEEELLPVFGHSSGLCVPHLRQVFQHTPDSAVVERLKAEQLAIWQRLLAELDEFIRKQDHRFADEPAGPEANAWARAIDLVSGQAGLGCQ